MRIYLQDNRILFSILTWVLIDEANHTRPLDTPDDPDRAWYRFTIKLRA